MLARNVDGGEAAGVYEDDAEDERANEECEGSVAAGSEADTEGSEAVDRRRDDQRRTRRGPSQTRMGTGRRTPCHGTHISIMTAACIAF